MQTRKVVRIPTGGCGLSEAFDVRGYRVASIRVPGSWTVANITFRGRPSSPDRLNQVVPNGTTAGLSVDAAPADIEMDNAVTLQSGRAYYTPALVDPIDISALLSAAATIDINDFGVLWVFQLPNGSSETGDVDVEVDKTTADHTSAIMALAQYSRPARTLPPTRFYIPIGAVLVNEGGSGAFTWGTDSITAETETYYSFAGLPEVLVRAATLALDAGAATFTYGAATVRLGTGVRVAATGKAGVTIAGSNVATGAVGAWLIYVLADDVEYALQLGEAYPNLASAQGAVANHIANPLLPVIGAMYVVNTSGAAFIPGTTFLDAAGIATTFVTYGPRYTNIFDDAGTELTVTAAADREIILSGDTKEDLTGLASLQLRSGTSGTPVDQANSPDLELYLETV